MTAAITAAMTIEPRGLAAALDRISSRVKVTAAIGVLNAAAKPAAAPTGIKFRRLRREIAKIRPNSDAMAAQICTEGPSRPKLAPVPIFKADRTILAGMTLAG